MAVHDLIKLDARIRATISTINTEGLSLHARRADLTDEGLRKQWDRIVAKYTPQVEEIAAQVEEAAAALDNVHGRELEALLPTVPDAGLTAAQELRVARLLDRPGVLELEALPTLIRPHLETPVATVLVEEVQARNPNVTEEYVTAILAEESSLFEEAHRAAQDGRTIVGVLRQGVEELRKALDVANVSGAALDSQNRPGQFLLNLQQAYGEGVQLSVSDKGDIRV